MTPKSLLRHPLAVSHLRDLASGRFREVLDDPLHEETSRRVLICSGKVYYDLLERREEAGSAGPAILRLEQFYPFPTGQLKAALSRYRDAKEWLWVQEEPRNMGGWGFMQPRLKHLTGKDPGYVGRVEAASPASGHLRIYREEQSVILDEAVGPLKAGNE
jgi:2-oxoglutarate dehydrogenase E1 component